MTASQRWFQYCHVTVVSHAMQKQTQDADADADADLLTMQIYRHEKGEAAPPFCLQGKREGNQ